MSQRVTKCTVCAEVGHTRLHCTNLCAYCSGDIRECGCEPPSKRPKPAKNSTKNYKREFDQLLVKYQQVSAAYRSTKEREASWPHEKRALVAELEALKEGQAAVAELEEDNAELVRLNHDKQREIRALHEEMDSMGETLSQRDEEIDRLKKEIEELRAAKSSAPASQPASQKRPRQSERPFKDPRPVPGGPGGVNQRRLHHPKRIPLGRPTQKHRKRLGWHRRAKDRRFRPVQRHAAGGWERRDREGDREGLQKENRGCRSPFRNGDPARHRETSPALLRGCFLRVTCLLTTNNGSFRSHQMR